MGVTSGVRLDSEAKVKRSRSFSRLEVTKPEKQILQTRKQLMTTTWTTRLRENGIFGRSLERSCKKRVNEPLEMEMELETRLSGRSGFLDRSDADDTSVSLHTSPHLTSSSSSSCV